MVCLINFMNKLLQTNLNILEHSDMSFLIVSSPAGFGKSTTVMNFLKNRHYQENKHYLYFNSYFTPLAFFQMLDTTNQLSNPKFLILDDLETIFQNKIIIEMLKSACWQNNGFERKITYNSTKSVQTEIVFTGKIILLMNSLTENFFLTALKDRGLSCELNFSREQILDFAKKELFPKYPLSFKQKNSVHNFIAQNKNQFKHLSLRTFIKGYNYIKFAPHNWQNLLQQEFIKSTKPVISTNFNLKLST